MRARPLAMVALMAVAGMVAVAEQQGTPQPGTVDSGIQAHVLPNGLRVVLSPDPASPTVAVSVSYRVGSRDDPPGRSGLVHMLEHLAIADTDGVMPGPHIREIQALGGTFSSPVWPARTVYSNEVPAAYLERPLWLESQRMRPLEEELQAARLERIRQGLRVQRARVDSQPSAAVAEAWRHVLYPATHPSREFVIGAIAQLFRASEQEIRDFRNRAYSPPNAYLAIAGNFDRATARRLVEQHFASLPRGPSFSHRDVPGITLKGERRIDVQSRLPASTLVVVWPVVERRPDEAAALRVTAAVLRQTTRSTAAYASDLEEFTLEATLQPGQTFADVERAVDAVIARLGADGPRQDELSAAREALAQAAEADLSKPASRAIMLSRAWMMLGDPAQALQEPAELRAVPAGEVRRAAATHLGSRRIVLNAHAQADTLAASFAPAPMDPANPILGVWRGVATDRDKTYGVEVLLERLIIGEPAGRTRYSGEHNCGGTVVLMERRTDGTYLFAETIDAGRGCAGGVVELHWSGTDRLHYHWRSSVSRFTSDADEATATLERRHPAP